jgi:hypothetical protein
MQVDPIRLKVDAFDQQFNDAGLLGREQLIPDRLELKEGAADLFSTRDSYSITAAATAASRFLFSLASASRSSLSRASILASSLSISLLT